MPSITFKEFQGGLDLRQGLTVADANRLRVLKNAYVTTGKSIKKRPGLVEIFDLSEEDDPDFVSVGLFAAKGSLYTFGYSTATYSNPLFKRLNVDDSTAKVAINAYFVDTYLQESDGQSYVFAVIEYDDDSFLYWYFNGDLIQWLTDSNCPLTKHAFKVGNKIFASSQDGDTVRFCATGNARDWTTANDAGFINTGDQRANSGLITALGQFNNKLAAFSADSIQVWTVGEDPANFALNDVLDIGTKYAYAHANLGGDAFFVSKNGIRSISQSDNAAGNLQEIDVGSPVDSIINTVFDGNEPKAIYYRAGGQYWLYYGTKALVYTFSRTSKISAWSIYEFPISLDYLTELSAELYVRSGSKVYQFSNAEYTDDGVDIDVAIELPFLDFKQSGVLKQIVGMDAIFSGTANIQHRFDPLIPELITAEVELTGDTRARGITPVELMTTAISPVITHSSDEAFEFFGLVYYFESLGVFP
jgi:hypothetical protein